MRRRGAHAWMIVLATASVLRAQGYPPDEALHHFHVPDGFVVHGFAAEPMVRQPLTMEFDDRGRMWIIQYLQYPNPAGLKRVKVDRFSRTVYDRVPEPPPRGPKGADRITILEDTDGDGVADTAKDFVSDLNLACGLAVGYGGVFVLQVPYLLFYPDANGDDVPDGDPEVLLSGFGMEDASAVANSLTWGPDGWLYGAQGSTVTAHIEGQTFQQGVWRYHPRTKKFELFHEGGGNTWGLDFDEHGQLLASTNYGGFVMVHGVQGGYYWKQFDKHGAFQNPYTFGFIDHVPYANFRGEHVTVGGTVYQGDSFSASFRGQYIAGNTLSHAVYWHHIEPVGSSFKTSFGGVLLETDDTWCAPTDITMGPDGSIYVADWYDKRTAHPDPDAEWDRSNGRIYKIEAKGTHARPVGDLQKRTSDDLVKMVDDKNEWYARKARRILAERRDAAVIPPLRETLLKEKGHRALSTLWALYVSGGFVDDSLAQQLLKHGDEDVRAWTVRFLGDESHVSPEISLQLIELALIDPSATVRSQLACSARRLPSADGMPIVWEILLRNADGNDPHIPLLLWWAVEQFMRSEPDQVMAQFTSAAAWQSLMIRDVILGRLMKRGLAATDYDVCARLLDSAANANDQHLLLKAMDEASRGLRLEQVPPILVKPFERLSEEYANDDTMLIRVAARLGDTAVRELVVDMVSNAEGLESTRIDAVAILAEVGQPEDVPALLKLIGGKEPESLQTGAIAALSRFAEPIIATTLLEQYGNLSAGLRTKARDLLLGRPAWALQFLQAVDQGKYPTEEVAAEQLRTLDSYHDEKIDELVHKHWGTVHSATPEEKLAEIRRLNNDLRAATGRPEQGQPIFKQLCATCHRLFGEGSAVGPDLTTANRKDRQFLLVSLVDPSLTIRKEFTNYIVETNDGRTLTGLMAEQTPAMITLLGDKGELTGVARTDVREIRESQISLMPEDQLSKLTPDQLRDLFAYLQSDKKGAP